MNLINKEEVVEIIQRFTGKSANEINTFVENNPIKYSDLRTFAMISGRFPDEKETKDIGNRGIDPVLGEMYGWDALNGII